jgi:hypothetical protein
MATTYSGRISGQTPTDEDVILDLTADLMTACDLGCRYLRAGNVPEHLLGLTAQLAERYGVSIGIEVHAPSRPSDADIQRLLAMGARQDLLDHIIANRHSGVSELQMWDEVRARGGGNAERAAIAEFFGFLSFGPADLDGFRTLLPWSHYFHSKFYHVGEDLTDQQIPVDKLLTDIVASGFEGVLMSEYEGHAFHLDDAEEQVARHLQLERRILSSIA